MEHIFLKKIGFVSSRDKIAKSSLEILKKKYDHVSPKKADIVVALGGDGTVLNSLHEYMERSIPIYGMNRGHIGFLMNKYSENFLLQRLNKAIPIKLHPLKIKCYRNLKLVKESLAFNDVSLIRDSRQIAKISIKINNNTKMKELLCDGCLISTPAGSSAYNLSLRGPVIPVDAQLLAITPISPYRPRRWRGALVPNSVKIVFTAHEIKNRPVRAEADFFDVKTISRLEVELDKTKFMNLMFDPGHDLEDRILNEQFVF